MSVDLLPQAPTTDDPAAEAEAKPKDEPQGRLEPPQDELPEFGPETALTW